MDRAFLSLIRHAVSSGAVVTSDLIRQLYIRMDQVANEWIADSNGDEGLPVTTAARAWREALAPQLHYLTSFL